MKFFFFFLSCFATLTAMPVFGQDNDFTPDKNKIIRFLENQGQISDRNHKPRPDVLFHVEGQGIYLKDDGITYVMFDSEDVIEAMTGQIEGEGHKDEEEDEDEIEMIELGGAFPAESSISTHQISMIFQGMNTDFSIKKSEKSTDYLNYYLEQFPTGIERVYSFRQITYQNVYDGIDIQFFGNKTGDLKYDYIIAPFADPSQIKLEWLGADSVFINPKGELVLNNQVKPFKEALPKVYQLINKDTVLIEAKYNLEYDEGHYYVSFDLGNYNPEERLIIDPWITNYGGEGLDGGRNVSTDNLGNVLVTGYTHSPLEIAEDGHLDVYGGIVDGFVVKLNPLGERLWGTYYGASDRDDMVSSAADSDNNIICVGYSRSATGIAYDGYQMTRMGISDAIMVKFDPDGIRIWSTYYGGEGFDLFLDVRVSATDDIYAVGRGSSLTGVASPGAYQTVYGGGSQDLYLVKFGSDGSRIWATYCGGEDFDFGGGIALDPDGTSYIAGSTQSSTGIATLGAHQETYAGAWDAFLVKFDSDGNRIWGTYLGTNYTESGADAITDTLGNVYLCGDTYSETGMALAGNQMTNGGPGDDDSHLARDGYVAQFNEMGVLVWATYVGGSNEDYGYSVAVDQETNNVVFTGDTYSSDYPTTGCGIQNSIEPAFGENAFISKFDVDGVLQCASYFGKEHEEATTVAIADCYLYLTGSTPTNISTPGAHQEFAGGLNDGFIAQLFKSNCSLNTPEYSLEGTQTDVSSCLVCDGTATVTLVSDDGCFDGRTLNYRWSNGEEFLNTTETSTTVMDVCATDTLWVAVELDCGFFDTLFFDFSEGSGFPTADFSSANYCLGESTSFTNLSTGTIVSYLWEFGDAGTSNLENPSHVYSDPGTYQITLTIENDEGCEHEQSYEITIFPSYAADIYSVVCLDSLYTFPDGAQIQITADTEEVTYLETDNGCDSLITTHITVIEGYILYDTIYTAYNTEVLFPDGETQLITETTEHISVFESMSLCDSVIHTTVLITVSEFLPPNIFTPGDDSRNDLFYFPAEGVANFECVIVNRWGIEVFKFDSITDKWDGVNMANGKACVDGVYFYIYSGTFEQGDTFEGQGSVQLVR